MSVSSSSEPFRQLGFVLSLAAVVSLLFGLVGRGGPGIRNRQLELLNSKSSALSSQPTILQQQRQQNLLIQGGSVQGLRKRKISAQEATEALKAKGAEGPKAEGLSDEGLRAGAPSPPSVWAVTRCCLYSNGSVPQRTLTANEYLESSNGRFRLTLSSQGILTLYQDSTWEIWRSTSRMHGVAPYNLTIEQTGHLVLYDGEGSRMWFSELSSILDNPPYQATVDDAGFLSVADAQGNIRFYVGNAMIARDVKTWNVGGAAAGMGIFCVARLLKLLELCFRALFVARRGGVGRKSMLFMDLAVCFLVFIIALAGFARGLSDNMTELGWLDRFEGDSVGICEWIGVVTMFWLAFIEFIYGLGSRADIIAPFNSFRRTRMKGMGICLGIYGWQMFFFCLFLDLLAATVLSAVGCNFGWLVVFLGPFGLFCRWYAFGGLDAAPSPHGSTHRNQEMMEGQVDISRGTGQLPPTNPAGGVPASASPRPSLTHDC